MPIDDDRGQRPRPTAGVTATLARRRALSWMLLPAAGLIVPAAWASAARIASARVWPAQEYTRLILEGPTPIAHQLLLLKDPHRIVLDLDGVEIGPELAQLPSRVQANDPYIAGIRFGRKAPDVLRVVIDLRAEVTPQLFALKPVAEFGHRAGHLPEQRMAHLEHGSDGHGVLRNPGRDGQG